MIKEETLKEMKRGTRGEGKWRLTGICEKTRGIVDTSLIEEDERSGSGGPQIPGRMR